MVTSRPAGGGVDEVTAGNFLPSSCCLPASIRVSSRLAIKLLSKTALCLEFVCQPVSVAPPLLRSAPWHRFHISVLLSVWILVSIQKTVTIPQLLAPVTWPVSSTLTVCVCARKRVCVLFLCVKGKITSFNCSLHSLL